MNLLLLGATGRTGRLLLAQAVQRGHDVGVLVRSPDKVSTDHRAEIRVGSVLDPGAVADVLKGRDAVLVTLGNRSVRELFGTTLMRRTVRTLVPAMEHRKVGRLIVLSALGVGETSPDAPTMIRATFRSALRRVAKDKAEAEEYVRASTLDWTFVYPPRLTNSTLTGSYRAGEHIPLRGTAKISRADVAHFMLGQLEDPTFSRRNAIISS